MTLAPVAAPPDLVKYQLLDEIGHGGMATVYRALDVRLGREVAVKLIHPHLRENAEAAARFITEARAVAKLRHPGIVEIYDISDEDDNERYLVAELVRGPSLRKLLRDSGPFPPEIGGCIGVLLCDALAHAHDASVIHRDVKPENVLVELDDNTKTASVKLTDFGIAKLLDAQGVTSTGQVLGSPAHMAPEQIEGGPIDTRADIFSVGVLLYECVVGQLPFDGKNPAQVLRRVLEGKYTPADRARPLVGARWAGIIARAMSRVAADRYQDIRQLGAALRGELTQAGIEDPLSEVYRYFRDPRAYESEAAPRIVETLVARAEKARAAGDIPAAAADLNRAIAYAPDDALLLAKLADLARGQRRRTIVRRAASVLVPFVVLGVGTWGAMTAHRGRAAPRSAGAPSSPAPLTVTSVVSSTPVVPDTSVAPALSIGPTAGATSSVAPRPVPLLRLDKDKVMPEVMITANLKNALYQIDGDPVKELGFGRTERLVIGPHVVRFFPPKGNVCCDPFAVNITVRPAEEGDRSQTVVGQFTFRDARVSLAGPMGSYMTCSRVAGEVRPGVQVAVKMTDISDQMPCYLFGAGLSGEPKQVQLNAGQSSVVPWPEP